MKYILLIHHEEILDEDERLHLLAESVQLANQLHEKRQYLDAAPLEPTSATTSVKVRDGKRLVTDGPFAETREQLGGYFLIDAQNLQEAIDIAGRIPGARIGTVEVRPVREVEGLPENSKHPTFANGKICYLEIPAIDIKASASFYKAVFGWQIRQRGDGSVAFDDAVGQVSGTWVLGRKAAMEPGLLTYIMVDSVAATIDAIIAEGGRIVQPIGMDAPEVTARFSDPAGNTIGLYQQPAS
jgi:predicted enzyme related to lactoylglutathione lyase